MKRSESILALKSANFDLLVIGGGITGAGIALDASSRGLKVALVEMQDFAGGTSSRSTKLIHGGLRYLKQGDIGLVREVGRERAVLHRNAPHLVIPEKMLMPIVEGGQNGKLLSAIGLSIYDYLAGVPRLERRKMMNKSQAINQEPLLDKKALKGGALFYEYRTDDARLTIEVLKTSMEHGAVCLNYLKVTGFIYKDEKISGVNLQDIISNDSFSIQVKNVVNACGPWVDELRLFDKSLNYKKLHLTKGVHLVVPYEKFPVSQSIYFDIPDGRMIFAIPRGKITYFGTTDTNYSGCIDQPVVTKEDAKYLIDAANSFFKQLNLGINDVISSWAGLRPLIHEEGKSATELSRKDEIFISKSGLISIAGGKLTGYRKMAERVVNLLTKVKSKTEFLNLHKTLRNDLEYTIENEWVETLHDYYIRRTGMLYFDPESMKQSIEKDLQYISKIKLWDSSRTEEEQVKLNKLIVESTNFS